MATEAQATLDTLPGEGAMRTTIQHRERRLCNLCGKPAHFKHSFLFENYRHNNTSSAYGKDDCSWCSDTDVFVCRDCKPETPACHDPGASVFPANEQFAHLFLYWYTSAVNEEGADKQGEQT